MAGVEQKETRSLVFVWRRFVFWAEIVPSQLLLTWRCIDPTQQQVAGTWLEENNVDSSSRGSLSSGEGDVFPRPANTKSSLHPDKSPTRRSLHPDKTPTRRSLHPDKSPTRRSLHPDKSPSRLSLYPDKSPTRRSLHPDISPTRQSLHPDISPTRRSLPPDISPTRRSLHPDIPPTRRSLLPDISPTRRSLPPDISPTRRSLPPDISSTRRSLPPDISPTRRPLQGHSTSFSTSAWTHCQLIAVSVSSQQLLCHRQPVLLMKCVRDQQVEYVFVHVRDMSSPPSCHLADTTYRTATHARCGYSCFSLELLKSCSFKTPASADGIPCSHSVFLSDCHLLVVNPSHITLCTTDIVFSQDLQIQDAMSVAGGTSVSHIQIIDAVTVVEEGALIAVISYRIADKLTRYCRCLKFSLEIDLTYGTSTERYSLQQLAVDMFFPPDYADILKVSRICSCTPTYNLTSRTVSLHTAVTMLTETGYALRFDNGSLQTCVSLAGYSNSLVGYSGGVDYSNNVAGYSGGVDYSNNVAGYSDGVDYSNNVAGYSGGVDYSNNVAGYSHGVHLSADEWSKMFVRVIHLDGCQSKTAVQVNSTCHLIDWTKEKIVKSWSSVSAAVSSDVDLCGKSSLIVVYQLEGAGSPHTVSHHQQLLQESQVAVVDVDNLQTDEVGSENVFTSDMIKQGHNQQNTDSELDNQPECAVSAFVGQHRQCQQAMTELEVEFSKKLSFLADTWQGLTSIDNQKLATTTNPDQQSLVVLAGGPECGQEPALLENHCKHLGQPCVETGTIWKRVIGSSLIFGVQVTNISHSCLQDVQINLIPAAYCQTGILETVSKFSMQTSNLANISFPSEADMQRKTGHLEFEHNSQLNRRNFLPPGKSTVCMCITDISHALSAYDFTVHIFVSFSVLTPSLDTHLPAYTSEGGLSVRHVEDHCTQLVVSSGNLLDGTLALGASEHLAAAADWSTVDLLALDCIHKHWTLMVVAVVSPVSCLSTTLTGHPAIIYLDWAGHFVFVATNLLYACRLQLLEQSSRYQVRVKLFARSHSQALLLVKFLYSILPEDISITMDTSRHKMAATDHVPGRVLHNIQGQISTIRGHLTGNVQMPQDGSVSPKFITRKRTKSTAPSSSSCVGSEKETDGVPPCTTSVTCTQKTAAETEKQVAHRARKRLREIWPDDSP